MWRGGGEMVLWGGGVDVRIVMISVARLKSKW